MLARRANAGKVSAAIEERLLREADSLAALLKRLGNRISRRLIGERQWELLLERIRELPATVAAQPLGFELPLHAIPPEADFGFGLVGGSRAAAFFEQRGRAPDADPAAAAIARLLAETAPDTGPLRRAASRVMMLEYDVRATPRGVNPPPGIFLYPTVQAPAGDRTGQRLRDLDVVVGAVLSAAGREPDAAERAHVEQVYSAMGPHACVASVGAFPARERMLRVAVTGFRKTRDVIGFLERAGWPGPAAPVAAAVSRLEDRGAFAHVAVHFDVRAAGLGPKLGLSFFAAEREWLKGVRHWTPLIDGIREQRLAVPEKLAALSGWEPGAELLFGKYGALVLTRYVHHVKLVITGDRFEEVKAYVFMAPRGAEH